jgi:hypothetical protein
MVRLHSQFRGWNGTCWKQLRKRDIGMRRKNWQELECIAQEEVLP